MPTRIPAALFQVAQATARTDWSARVKGTGALVLYLDFDGVLHHENCLWHPRRGAYLSAPERYTLFQHSLLLEQVLAPYPQVQIVLSTSWVRRYGYSGAVKRLPPSLQARVVGATFHSRHMHEEGFSYLHRGEQVHADVLRRRPRDWLALDDDGEGWPLQHASKFVQTHMYEGISDLAVQIEFKMKLKKMCNDSR
jgi:hypothetical protein